LKLRDTVSHFCEGRLLRIRITTGDPPRPLWTKSGCSRLRATENAGSVVTTDGVDGLHLTAESERKLGVADAAKVKEMLK